MTSLRRAWFGDYLYQMRLDGVIADWSWSSKDTRYWDPMTMPALSKDQRDTMIADYCEYVDLISEGVVDVRRIA